MLILLNVLATSAYSVTFLVSPECPFFAENNTSIDGGHVLIQEMAPMLQPKEYRDREHRSSKHLEGTVFSSGKTIGAICDSVTDFVSQTCRLWHQNSPGAERWQNRQSRSSPYIIGLLWFFACELVISIPFTWHHNQARSSLHLEPRCAQTCPLWQIVRTRRFSTKYVTEKKWR